MDVADSGTMLNLDQLKTRGKIEHTVWIVGRNQVAMTSDPGAPRTLAHPMRRRYAQILRPTARPVIRGIVEAGRHPLQRNRKVPSMAAELTNVFVAMGESARHNDGLNHARRSLLPDLLDA